MFNRSRDLLAAAAIAISGAFAPLAAAAALMNAPPNPFRMGTPPRRSRARPGKNESRGYLHPTTRKLVKFVRPAAPFIRNPNNGLHWENDELVGPARGKVSEWGDVGKLEPKRKPAKAHVRAAKAKKYASPKAEARALRRNGTISTRQQRKLRKRDPRLIAPQFYGMDLRPQGHGGTALQSLGQAS